MMIDELKKQLNQALKDRDSLKVSVLRFLLAKVKNAQIDKSDFDDCDFVAVVLSQIKKTKESIEAFEKAGRSDLSSKEKEELKILSTFLPQQMTKEELENQVRETIKKLNASSMADFGKVMQEIMPKVKGKANGRDVSLAVKQALS